MTNQKYIRTTKQGNSIFYRVYFNRKDCKINKIFNDLEEAIKYRDMILNEYELKRLEEAKIVTQHLSYPFNIMKVLGLPDDIDIAEYFDDALKFLFDTHQLTITEREKVILNMRFKQEMSLEKIGVSFGVARERIRQISDKALYKIKNYCMKYFTKDFSAIKLDFGEIKKEYEKQKADYILSLTYDTAKEFVNLYESSNDITKYNSTKIGIEELDFSVRTFNCLKRANITTLHELCDKTETEILKIRSMGKKCVKEIKSTLKKMGLKLREEDVTVW